MRGRTRERAGLMGWPEDDASRPPLPGADPGRGDPADGPPGGRDPQAGSWEERGTGLCYSGHCRPE